MDNNNEYTNIDESIDIETSRNTSISQVECFTKESSSDVNGDSLEHLLVKIPVVLADINVIFNMEANFKLDRLAKEIKSIEKNVFLTQSCIVNFLEYEEPNTVILFIKGFIKNNIEYTSSNYNAKGIKKNSRNIRYCIVESPFEFNTKITLSREPILSKNSNKNKLEFCNYKSSEYDNTSNNCSELNLCNEGSLFTEIFNEKPFIELIRADIIEVDVKKNSILKDVPNSEERVTNIIEKSVVNLALKVLQRQEVKISTL